MATSNRSRRGGSQKTEIKPLDPTILTQEQLAALEMEIEWLNFRSDFERRMAQDVMVRAHSRNVFETDMVCAMVLARYLEGRPITLKEMTTYFMQFITEATLSRHLDDMEAAGALVKQ